MNNGTIKVLAVVALIVTILAEITWYGNHTMNMQNTMNMASNNTNGQLDNNMNIKDNINSNLVSTVKNNHDYAKNLVKPRAGQPIKKFSLVANETTIQIKDGVNIIAWTYNGSVPGQEIRVIQGDFVQVELKNELKDPVTIHWHGYPLTSAMDGIPGITQDSVKPGESFTYEFSADVTGTYWYHSHQEGSKQVDKGLYGALIVEPKEKTKITKDFTLMIDEWTEKPMDETQSMGGMKTDSSTDPVLTEEKMMAENYNIYTINGKSGKLISPLEVKKGDIVRLRLINSGYRSHGIHIPGQDFKVVATDGQDIVGATLIKDQVIYISPGERYDVEFTLSGDDNFYIDAHDDNKYNDQIKIPVRVTDGNGQMKDEKIGEQWPVFDFTSYGTKSAGKFSLDQKYDIDYPVELNTRTTSGLKYTINGKTFDELPPLNVNTGNTVKFTFDNKSKVDHPMHLHGHFFQVLSKNGNPVSGAVIIKDTLLVKPGEKYVVAFKADNPGYWVEHCHELHHAAAGMMQKIVYADYKSNYTADPSNKFNKPE